MRGGTASIDDIGDDDSAVEGPAWRRLAGQGTGVAFLVTALLLALALATYNPSDPSLDTAVNGDTANALGRLGADAADLLLQTFGVAGWLLPLVIFDWAVRMLLGHGLRHLWRRVLLLPPLLCFTALMLTIVPAPPHWPTKVGFAGFAGPLLAKGLDVAPPVAAMAAAGLVGLILLYILGFSWPRRVPSLRPGEGRMRTGEAMPAPRRNWTAALVRAPLALGGALRQSGALLGAWWRASEDTVDREVPLRREPQLAGRALAEDDDQVDEPRAPVPAAPRRAATVDMPARKGRAKEPARQASLDLGPAQRHLLPPLDLLAEPLPVKAASVNEESLQQNARLLESVLEDFGIRGQIVKVRPGPVVTLYELEPAPGIKASRIIGLADDIARSMSAISARVAVIPGRNVIGIELPNAKAETVHLRELLASEPYERTSAKLALVLGKDIGGLPVIADLARMPHLLIAGTTGSGKSVGINTMILSILYRLPPDQCKFIMIDPKMLELSVYDGIPHLLAPVVTEPRKAVVALKWTVREMENRYRAMSKLGVRNIEGYNQRLAEAAARGETLLRKVQTGFDAETGQPIFEEQPLDTDPLPLIIVVVDEMADLMLVAGKDIEAAVQRLAQMARAAGIHIVMATQRPSVDVITGTIKANFPTRISFQVTSKIDSRTILGEAGAEQLLGRGDMLYMAGGGRITRVHGPFVSDQEVEAVVRFLKDHGAPPTYIEDVTEDDEEGGAASFGESDEGSSGDALYDQAVALVCRERKASTSFVQRHLQIGYNRAARIIERMETEGVISGANHVGKREVLARNID
jgi:S-DNA-T family DNA segregation ATPase FtsK/SpoIIIE